MTKGAALNGFIVSAVLIDRENDNETPAWVTQINNKIGVDHDHVIKFTSLDHDQQLSACQQISELPIRIFVVASNKKNMRGYENKRAAKMGSKQWFYNWMVRVLAERVTDYCLRRSIRKNLTRKHVKFVFSQSGGHSYSQTSGYHALLAAQSRSQSAVLQRWVPRWEVMHWSLVEDYPHYKRAGLQLADVTASAFYQAVDNLDSGPCCLDFAKALEPRIARNKGKSADYGVVLLPYPSWEADISEEQRQVFRCYGYDFIKKW